MDAVAFPLLVLAVTGSASQAGLAGFAQTLPYALFTLAAGALVDRWDRRRVMIAADAGRALLLGLLGVAVLAGWAPLALILAVVFAEAVLAIFFDLASIGLLRAVVPVPDIGRAAAVMQARDAAAMLAGGPIGGLLFGLHRALPFLGDALSYLVGLIATILIRPGPQQRAAAAPIAALVLLLILLTRQGGASAASIGVLSALIGAGGLAGAALTPLLIRRLPARRIFVGIGWYWTAALPATAFTTDPYLLGALGALLTLPFPAWNAAVLTRTVAVTPDHLFGRVQGVRQFVSRLATPCGPLFTGLAYEVLGGRATAFVLLAAALLMAATGSLLKDVLPAEQPDEPADRPRASGEPQTPPVGAQSR
ncbi:Predicted arabinose efflux permease, MFS family [Paractinoplanes atraurantiacus]|uniref:Predicted arabinose efflux permease, MFS family n=1 Tax=Paractinoplanes atraurantiacus TaxID=1036182 RepID=A0A285I3X2_9ACTN|nr:MFS transporter [Actinoplanes atraurantiacus]SNY42644.1 Predicted arabinose efflux permease, MFS family [Actinoplanes atraurantiacus]